MKVSYMLPSGTYNIILNKEELNRLIGQGSVHMHTGRIPCKTGRACYVEEHNDMVTLDKKEIFNGLCFELTEPVNDIEEGVHNVQFVNIIVED